MFDLAEILIPLLTPSSVSAPDNYISKNLGHTLTQQNTLACPNVVEVTQKKNSVPFSLEDKKGETA
jgi:hypothetical protein